MCHLIKKQINFLKSETTRKTIYNVSGGISSSFSLKELSSWCAHNIFPQKIGSRKKSRPFDLKWIVLDNSEVKKDFKWNIKFSKYKIFKDIKSNDN